MNLYIIGVKKIYIIGIPYSTGNVFSKMGMFLTQILVQTSVGTFDDSRDFFFLLQGERYIPKTCFCEFIPLDWIVLTPENGWSARNNCWTRFVLFQLDSNQYIISTRFISTEEPRLIPGCSELRWFHQAQTSVSWNVLQWITFKVERRKLQGEGRRKLVEVDGKWWYRLYRIRRYYHILSCICRRAWMW